MLLFLKNLLFTLVVPGFVALWVPLSFFERHPEWPAGAWQWHHWLGSFFLAVGTTIYGHCLWLFATYGRGTPAPIDPPQKLVQRGLYRCVRNPMYLGGACLSGRRSPVPALLAHWDLLGVPCLLLPVVCRAL
ncbi:MAG: methyltransferase family protein [Opitutales bacterium]